MRSSSVRCAPAPADAPFCSAVPFIKNDGADIVLESLLQRAFIKSKAIDVEALCIYTGKRVWRLKVPAALLRRAYLYTYIHTRFVPLGAALAHASLTRDSF